MYILEDAKDTTIPIGLLRLSDGLGFLHFTRFIIHTGPCVSRRNRKRVRIQCHTSLLIRHAIISSQPRRWARRRAPVFCFALLLISSSACTEEQMPWAREWSVELLQRLQLHELCERNHHPHRRDHRYSHLNPLQLLLFLHQIKSFSYTCIACMWTY